MFWNNKNESNPPENEKINEINESEGESGALEIGYLTGAILDYYEITGKAPLEDGDEWKEGTEHEPKPKAKIPEDLDDEIKKAFMTQIKKFQK